MFNMAVLFPWPVLADEGEYDVQRSRLQLNRVIKQLVEEKKALGLKEVEKKGLLADLDKIDRSLAKTETQLVFLAKQQQKAQGDLPLLEEQIEIGRYRVAEMQRQLKAHLRLMYGLGGQGVVKVAFSQDNSSRVRQSVLYYGRLIKSRNAKFKAFNQSVEELNRSVEQHKNLVAKVSDLSEKLSAEREIALKNRIKRGEMLQTLQQEAKYHQKKIDELSRSRSSLSSFMERLSNALSANITKPDIIIDEEKEEAEQHNSSVPTPSTVPKQIYTQNQASNYAETAAKPRRKLRETKRVSNKKITRIKGQLPLPVWAQGFSRKPGLFFQIAKNSPVKAIHNAQVVYADWFRGYGLLIILNHGDNIYSLYGHNSRLLVVPGDHVEASQVIAHTGDTGSLEGVPGLYFEIRERGKAVNPNRWLAKM
ncbi:MAG: peptidoglycan DD-metalloendopeptidase family protein [Magnetococcales bacterium]|nr:peptidoglycan DD-metalloendopeptidase family protein [Magnetococcales bacterium]